VADVPVGTLGGVVSTIHVAAAGVGSVAPFTVANTLNVCERCASPA